MTTLIFEPVKEALLPNEPALFAQNGLNSKADLSGEMALRIEKALAVKMDTLMRMQLSYDSAQTRKREKDIRSGSDSGVRTREGMLGLFEHKFAVADKRDLI